MNYSPLRFSILAILSAIVLSACSSDDEDPVSPMRTGQFLDSAVEGLRYATPTEQGVTDANGEFSYLAGEEITFSIGEIALPTVAAAAIMTPLQIFRTDDINATAVVNLSRLLQSLDVDGNPQNGIMLSDQLDASTEGLELDFSSADFAASVVNLVANSGSQTTELIESGQAVAHLRDTLQDNNLVSTGCTAEHPSVGRTAEFENMSFHGVSGTLTVIDDCTLEITNFNYDGLGPDVYFYAARDRNYRGNEVFIIGDRLNRTKWVNDNLRVTIPDGRSLDDFNSISVWCLQFGINFGDAFFGES